MEKVRILQSQISTGSFQEMVEEIFFLSQEAKGSYVCVANVHMLIEAVRDKEFARVLNNADLATPDGAPVAKIMKPFYGINQDRVAGMDLMPVLMKEAIKRNKSVYLYGGAKSTLHLITERIRKEFPHLKLAGTHSPPYRKGVFEEEEDLIDEINNSGADLIFVALGCPKQEKWMALHRDRLNACMIGLGGAFEVFAGLQKRAPLWMQQASLEWLFRLCQEPGRLWKRYVTTNMMFIYLVAKWWLRARFRMLNVK